MTKEEIQELLLLRKIKYLRTIKNCVVFFAVLTVIGFVAGLLLALNAL